MRPCPTSIGLRACVLGLAILSACSGSSGPAGSDSGGTDASLATRDLLTIGPDALVDVAALEELPIGSSVSLSHGQRAHFRLELAGSVTLDWRARSTGPGSLRAQLTELDPSDEALRDELVERDFDCAAAGEHEASLRYEAGEGALVELALEWSSQEHGAALVLDELSLSEAPREAPRTIVLVSIDTLTARHMSAYGYARATTPALEAFASEAVLFEQCMANAPFTTQSYISQFSGLLPTSCESESTREPAQRKPLWELWSLPERRWTLAESLRARGYRTAAWIDNLRAGPEYGLDQGFERYDMQAANQPLWEPDGGLGLCVDEGLRWLREGQASQQPSFVFLQGLDVHAPYCPPDEVVTDWADDLYEREHQLPVSPIQFNVYGCVPANAFPPAQAEDPPSRYSTAALIDAYDHCIRAVDAQLGRLFDELRALGLYEDALIVLSADHGETMLEHELHFQHGSHYGEVLHVPLIVRLPGGAQGGRRVSERVQLLDLYPTITELAGVNSQRAHLHGRSLLALMRGESLPPTPILAEEGILRSRAVLADGWKLIESFPEEAPIHVFLSSPWARELISERFPVLGNLNFATNGFELLLDSLEDPALELEALSAALRGAQYELFDIDADPLEAHNLAAEEPERLERMRALLARMEATSSAARAAVPPSGSSFRPTAAQQRELMHLGYGNGLELEDG